jgi:RimJ/RimL family protein N-acetyltransferase
MTPGDPIEGWDLALPSLVTSSLVLREPRDGDAAPLWKQLAAEPVARMMREPPASRAGFERFFQWASRERALRRAMCYVIHPAGEPEPAGLIQARALDTAFGLAEWGFCLGKAFWGTGVFVEAARAVADFLFRHVATRRIEARVLPANGRATGALRKLGALHEGLLRRSFERDGERFDQVLWTLHRDDWLARTPEPVCRLEPGAPAEPVVSTAETAVRRSPWGPEPIHLADGTCALRPLAPEDAVVLADLLSSPGVSRFLSPPADGVRGFEQFIRWTIRQRESGRSIALGIVPVRHTRPVGLFQLHSLSPHFDVAEWGFALGEPYWGSGLYQAGARLMLNFAFDIVGIRRLEARAGMDNARACGALRKLGATPEGRLRRSFLVDDRSRDDILWAILDDEWRAGDAAALAWPLGRPVSR